MKRKFFSILTALALCLTLLPTTVWAEEGETPTATTTTVATADDLSSAIGSADIVQLTADIEISSTLTINRTVTLDLNGKVLKMTGSGSVIKVESNGDLTLMDSAPTAEHKFAPDENGLWVLDESNGTETVSGGVITGGVASDGGGVYIAADSTSGGVFTMIGGNIVGCTARQGGGVYVERYDSLHDESRSAVFTMSGSSIIGCTAQAQDSTNGGGICNNGITTLSGSAVIRDCHAIEYSSRFCPGGGICSDSGSLTIRDDVRVADCTANGTSDAMYISSRFTNSSFTISGGTFDGTVFFYTLPISSSFITGGTFNGSVTNNRESTISGGTFNGTVNNSGIISNGTFKGAVTNVCGDSEIKGGRITGGSFFNTVTNETGSDKWSRPGVISGGTFEKVPDGTFTVTFNTSGGSEVPKQILVNSPATRPTDPTKPNHSFDGWYTDEACTQVYDFTQTVTKNITLYANWSISHDHCLCGTNTAYDGHDAHTDVSWEPWTATDSLPNAAGHYYLTDNVVLPDGETTLPGGVFLCLNGKSIKSAGYVTVSGTLTITDCKDNSGSIGTFKLNSGKLTMYSGTFSEHTVFDPGTTFLMTGHAVNNGILEIDGDAVFTMEGNAESKSTIQINYQPSVQATIRGNAKVTGKIQVEQPQEDARGLKLEGNAYVKMLCGTMLGTKIPVEMHDHAVIEGVSILSVALDIRDDAKIGFSDAEQSISIAQATLQGNVQIAGQKITILINSDKYTLTLQDNVKITGDITLVTYNDDPLTLIMKGSSVIKGSLIYEREQEQSSLVMEDNTKIDGDLDMGKATVRGSVYCTGEIKSGVFDAGSLVVCDGIITGGTFYGTVSGTIADSAAVAVTFDSGDAAKVQKVLRGQKADKPTPTKSGYAFEGWFTDAECTQEYDFDTPVLEPLTLTAKWTRVSSGGGGGGRNSYTISTPKADNGTVTINNGSTAKRGDTVSITVKPDAGYELGKITVIDSKGNSVSLTDKGDGKFSFTMPDGKVDVKATFVQAEPDQPGKTAFVDVPNGIWYEDAANFVDERGLMSGVGEKLFGGSQSTTRGMLMTILARMDGQDVTGGAIWYEKGMTWARANGVSDGTMPTANITREQLATMLYSYAKLKGIDTTQGGMAVREFADFDSISPWAGQSMTWAVNAGILSGRGNNTLAPTAGATRAEMAVMLQQFVGLMEK